MYLFYIDESGTADIPGNTSHFVLAGISIPISYWRTCDREIEAIKGRYHLAGAEIHIAWILRPYLEQRQIADFARLDYSQRRSQVDAARKTELFRLQRAGNPPQYKQTKKNYEKTEAYAHLTFGERQDFCKEIARCVSQWGFARLFAECVDKVHFDPTRSTNSISEQSFEQIVTRFETYMRVIGAGDPNCCGLLIHDNNETVARRHTDMMRQFHSTGTMWTTISKIIETPLFVDSQLTSMVQIADVCAYALRRYLENGERDIFDLVFRRADRRGATVVGVRHFTKLTCNCDICSQHRNPGTGILAPGSSSSGDSSATGQ